MLIKRFNPYTQIGPEPKIPAAHRKFYLWLLGFFLVGIFLSFLVMKKQVVTCVYNNQKSVYNCEVNSKTLFIDLGTKQFNNIIKADLTISRGTCGGGGARHPGRPGNLYHMKFIDANGLELFIKELGCTSDSIFPKKDKAYKAASEKINKINAIFAENKDFVYELNNQILGGIIFSCILIFVPLIIFFVLMRSAKARRILNEFCLHAKKDN